MQPPVPGWWNTRWMVALLIIAAAIPLLWPTTPPLVDLPGHMARYVVQLEPADSVVRHWFDFRWQLIGNLGVDLLIVPLAHVFGIELGVKLIVIAIPVMTVAGLLWIAREVHGSIPPTALFALPLAYGHPLIFGFVNFALSMALGLLAFALWLRLARLGRLRLRAMLFVPISILLWVCHTFGWGMLGVLAFSAELIRQHDRDPRWLRAAFHAGLHCSVMGLPVVLMLAWRSGAVSGQTGDWFNWDAKFTWLEMTLRDRWQIFDMASMGVLFGVLIASLLDKRLTFSRNLATSALFLVATFILLPRIVFGSAYADMRLTPFMFAIAIVAIRPNRLATGRFLGLIAALGGAFYSVRLAANTVSFALIDARYKQALVALDHVPQGARLVTFVGYQCQRVWDTNRMEHLAGLAMVRRHAFTNDQWDMAGAQLLRIRPGNFGRFGGDPSQLVTPGPCHHDKWRSIDWSLDNLPHDEFDYVWMVAPPAFDPRGLAGMTEIWRSGNDRLLRIDHAPPEPAK